MRSVEIGGGDETLPEHLRVDMYGSPEVRADIRALPFRNLDRVYASHVLEHVPDAGVVVALKSIRSTLKENGVFEAYVPDLPWFFRRFLQSSGGQRWGLWNHFIFGSQEDEGQYHKTGFSVKRLSDCLIAAGFRQVKVRRTKERQKAFGQKMKFDYMYLMEIHAVATA